MMQENLNTLMIAGGKARCTPAWKRKADEQDQCFKIYFLVTGSAELRAANTGIILRSGRIYIIDGHRLESMSCPAFMDVYWLHFEPESLYFAQVLSALPVVTEIRIEDPASMAKRWQEAIGVFEKPHADINAPQVTVPFSLECMVQSLVLDIVNLATKQYPPIANRKILNAMHRFRDVLNYMDTHFKDNTALQDLAKRVGMAPEYFHRQFSAIFDTTPHDYMLTRRISMAQHLLQKTNISIKEIAAQCGYDNPFYFSRIFTRRLKVTPSQYRRHSVRM